MAQPEPSEQSIKRMENFVASYCEKSGTWTHPDREVTEVVVKGLASHLDTLGRPLCPCRFYPDKQAEIQYRTWICACDDMQIYKYCHCLLFVNEAGLPITEYLPAEHEGRQMYGLVTDPTPDKGRPLRDKAAERERERRERPPERYPATTAAMDPELRLEPLEARVLGVLVEKALTTPEQYPLTLNAVVNGANQKTNRDPVLELAEDAVSEALDGLVDKQLARKVFPGNSRVDKYCHTGTSALKVDIAQLALLAELMMRGPQTPAELRTRGVRMVPIDSAEHLASLLDPLEARGLVERVPAGRGFRAERVAQCLCPGLHGLDAPVAAVQAAPEETHAPSRAALAVRLAAVEATVAQLERQLRALAEKLGEPLDP